MRGNGLGPGSGVAGERAHRGVPGAGEQGRGAGAVGTTITAATAGVSHSMALVAPPPGSTAPPDLPTTGSASLPITLTTATLLILTGATFIHLAHQHRSTRRLR